MAVPDGAAPGATRPRRADLLVVEQGLALSRARAQALILAGVVLRQADDARVDKPGALLPAACRLRLKAQPLPYVSRGGLKLVAALERYAVPVRDRVALDVGASTGGFTDCLLQHGARRVYAVDVGTNQLAYRLRQDRRVAVHERCDIRRLPPGLVAEACAVVVIDVSFISLRLVLPAALAHLSPGGHVVALIKPQFEVGPAAVGKGGVVRCADARRSAVEAITEVARAQALVDVETMPSPILGTKGNQEFLLHASRP